MTKHKKMTLYRHFCFLLFLFCIRRVEGSAILLDVYYPESNLNADYIANYYPNPGTVFGVSITTCQTVQGTDDCPGGEQAFDPDVYSISNITNRVGPNHWQKTFDLGDIYTGEVVVKLIAMQSLGVGADDHYFVTSSVPQCIDQAGNYEITAQYCEQPGSPYIVSIVNTSETVELVTFPWFGLDGGMVVNGSSSPFYAALTQVYSPELNNSRNISVYIPPSILQNSIPRAVNIMLMMDGEYGVTFAFAFRGGFELAVVTGVAPESIMIGVPSAPDAFDAAPTGPHEPERTYELTFAVCNSSLMNCDGGYTVNNTGGTDLLLDWLNGTVIPLVLDVVGMLPGGEVSIAGASLGGLTALYAAGTRPDQYARAWSMEGDTPYNFGQVSQKIIDSYSKTGRRAKAVVMQIGNSAYSTFTNPSTNQTLNELDFMMQANAAFQSTGLIPASVQCESYHKADMPSSEYPYTAACSAPDAVVATFLQMNGQHSIQSWITVFSLGLPYLYSAQYSAVNGTYKQRIYNEQYLSVSSGDASSSSSSSSNSQNIDVVIVLSILLFLTLVGLVLVVFAYRSLLHATSNTSKEVGPTVANPMDL
mmetsp:Transcript_5493/g.8979  ORF Transcript_5493/g.8979 Transcript_5493/m.8979 type:complete len:590 (-) Transcript_5493:174-1943(-)